MIGMSHSLHRMAEIPYEPVPLNQIGEFLKKGSRLPQAKVSRLTLRVAFEELT